MKHLIKSELLERTVSVHLVGCGGTGSQMLTGLARLDRALRALGHPGGLSVCTWDPDRVSESNVGRQLFYASDVGHFKSICLTNRVNTAFSLAWKARPEPFCTDTEIFSRFTTRPDIIITCVDTAAARRSIGSVIQFHGTYSTPAYWLDMGNRADDGQVILGEPDNRYEAEMNRKNRGRYKPPSHRLPHVLDLFPELADPNYQEDNAPSCSLAEALEKQSLFINQEVATHALNLLARLFRYGGLDYHGVFFNLAEGRANPLPVPDRCVLQVKNKT